MTAEYTRVNHNYNGIGDDKVYVELIHANYTIIGIWQLHANRSEEFLCSIRISKDEWRPIEKSES